MWMYSRKWQKQGKRHITQDHLQQSAIAIPDNKDIADRFEELISPIFNQIIKLHEEILNLTKQRDKLLPLLMNGQVSVNSDLAVLYIIYGLKYQNHEREHYSGDSCENAA